MKFGKNNENGKKAKFKNQRNKSEMCRQHSCIVTQYCQHCNIKVEEELLILPQHPSSFPYFSGDCIAQYLVVSL